MPRVRSSANLTKDGDHHSLYPNLAPLCCRNGCTQPRYDLLTDAYALLHMREARQNELVDTQTPVGQEFVSYLLRCADNGGTTIDPYRRQTIPQMATDTMLGDTCGLCLLPHHRRPDHDSLALSYDVGISVGNQAISGGPGGVRVVAYH